MGQLKKHHLLLVTVFLACYILVTEGTKIIERHCDGRILVGYDKCLCSYKKNSPHPANHLPYQLKMINCTNQNFSEIQSISRLRQLSTSLDGSHYDELETFIFVGNTIREIPQNIVGKVSLDQLIKMDLSNNHIHTIHGKTFHSLPVLQELILDNNDWYVDNSSPRVFSSIFNIEVLRLNNAFTSGNKGTKTRQDHITSLSKVFEGSKLDYLRELYLEHNGLVSVNSTVFQNLPSLEKLSLANNYIRSVNGLWNSTCFPSEYVRQYLNPEHISRLKHLDLSNNLITAVPKSFLDEIDKLHSFGALNLTGNPFRCDYHIRSLHKVLTGQRNVSYTITDVDNLICDTPAELKFRKIISLDASDLPEYDGKENKNINKDERNDTLIIALGVLFGVLASVTLISSLICICRYHAMKKEDIGMEVLV